MSNTLKINAAGGSTGSFMQFFERYQIWKDYCNFYKNHDSTPVVEITQDGIPYFYYNDIKNINASPSNLIFIDCSYDGVHCSKVFKK